MGMFIHSLILWEGLLLNIGGFAITKAGNRLGYVCSTNGHYIILKFHNSRECFPEADLNDLAAVPPFHLPVCKKPESIDEQDVNLINNYLKPHSLKLSRK
jgi:hypothetical protein